MSEQYIGLQKVWP